MDNLNKSQNSSNLEQRDSFGSKLGIIAAAAGSAIGLGNIWRFPYITGENGGGAFLVIYLICIAALGIPIMISEFIIGRNSKKNAIGAFRKLAPGTPWSIIGWMGLVAAVSILSFYGVVAGWCMDYVAKSATNAFTGLSSAEVGNVFTGLITSTGTPIFWQLLFMFLTAFIVILGIQNGIEKYSKILMPILFILIIVLDIRALTLPGAGKGLEFLFKFNFSDVTRTGVFTALGHAFFSLSIGMGTMITYGSYIGKKENLGTTAVQVTIADTLIAILAGIAIFPAVFSYGIDPTEGAGLAFMTLPLVFQQMPLGGLFATLFFLLLTVAALTSSISILEVIVAFFSEEFNISRKKVTVISTVLVSLIGILCSLSNGPVLENVKFFGLTFMDLMDYLSANILLPLGGLLISLFIGWFLSKDIIKSELTNEGSIKAKYIPLLMFLIKFISPFAISLVFLNGLGLL